MYHTTEYHREFWDAARGKPVSYSYIQNGRNTANGSYRLPIESDKKFTIARKEENIFRQIATVVGAPEGEHVVWAYDNEPSATWLNQRNTNSFFENTEVFEKHKLSCRVLGASILIPEDFCSDASFDVEAHILKDFGRSIGRAEEAAFISGDGVDAPHGFFNDAVVGHTTGNITYDSVIRLFFSLDKEYRRNAVWIMNDETALKLRTLKDANGNYLWNHTDNTIMGKPVYISNYMPGEATGAKPIAFGDFSYYWIFDRKPFTMRRLNELFVAQQQIGFLGYEYLDAKLIRPDAIHVMQIGA